MSGAAIDPFREVLCEQCRKKFIRGFVTDWAYKKRIFISPKAGGGERIIWFCSWRCLRAWEKEHKK